MRAGQNPFNGNSIKPPEQITVCVLVCIPELTDYFEGSLESLKLCLSSLVDHTEAEFDLVVMDNGSCDAVVSYLQSQLTNGVIDYLILSQRNIGKPNAQRQLLRFSPGDI